MAPPLGELASECETERATINTMNNRRRQRNKTKREDFFRSLCFLMPSLLGVGVFFILPFFVVVYYSMIDGVSSRNFVFLDNFIKLLDNSAFKMAAKNTLQFSFTAVPLAVVLAMGLALMLECRIPGKSRFRRGLGRAARAAEPAFHRPCRLRGKAAGGAAPSPYGYFARRNDAAGHQEVSRKALLYKAHPSLLPSLLGERWRGIFSFQGGWGSS